MEAESGRKVKAIVTGITNFGAFVKLEDGSSGLIHISQVSDHFVRDIHDYLSVGQEVEAILLSKDENGKISLSLKKPKESTSSPGGQPALFEVPDAPKDFESMMDRYKSVSEERLSDLKRIQNGGKASYKKRK